MRVKKATHEDAFPSAHSREDASLSGCSHEDAFLSEHSHEDASSNTRSHEDVLPSGRSLLSEHSHENTSSNTRSQKLAENKPENPQKPLLSSKQSRNWTLPWTLPSLTKVARGALSCVLSLLMIVSLASCRDSDVLTEKVIGDINQYDIDYSLSPAMVEVASATSTRSRDNEESERESEWEYEEPNYGDDATTDGETAEQVQSDTAQDSGEASEGTDEGTRSGVTSLSNDEDEGGQLLSYLPGTSGDPDEDPDADQTTQAEEQTPDTPTSSSKDSSGGSTDSGTIYNPVDGNYENIPTGTTRIAAAGPYATIVQAIGGKNALAAVNQEWLDNLPDAAFNNGDELENTVGISAWGDGTSMNDETVQAIIDTGAETVLVSDTYAVISQDQADVLASAGVNVVVMPPIGTEDTLDEDIVTTVQVVGQLLKDAGDSIGLDSVAMASLWKYLHTQALERTLQLNGGYSVTYDNVTASSTMRYIYQGTNSQLRGNQDSISNISSNQYWCLYFSHWYDEISESSYKTFSGSKRSPYLPNGYTIEYPTGAAGTPRRSSNVFYNYSNFALVTYYFQLSGGASLMLHTSLSTSTEDLNGIITDLIFRAATGSGLSVVIGDEDFSAVIAKNKDIADKIKASADYIDSDSMTVGLYNFGRSYQIWFMPAGIDGSWGDGTFESFLAVPWLYCMFQQGGDLSYSDEFVDMFYQAFYRCGGGGGIVDEDPGSGTVYGGYGWKYDIEANW